MQLKDSLGSSETNSILFSTFAALFNFTGTQRGDRPLPENKRPGFATGVSGSDSGQVGAERSHLPTWGHVSGGPGNDEDPAHSTQTCVDGGAGLVEKEKPCCPRRGQRGRALGQGQHSPAGGTGAAGWGRPVRARVSPAGKGRHWSPTLGNQGDGNTRRARKEHRGESVGCRPRPTHACRVHQERTREWRTPKSGSATSTHLERS